MIINVKMHPIANDQIQIIKNWVNSNENMYVECDIETYQNKVSNTDNRKAKDLEKIILKQCPFCGIKNGENEDYYIQYDKEYNSNLVYMHCFKCHARGPKRHTEKEAEKAWNKRAEVSE